MSAPQPMWLRLFVAIDLPHALKTLLHEKQLELKQQMGAPLRLVHKDQMHLTLSFMPKVPKEALETIVSELSLIEAPPIEMTLGELGYFGPARHPKVIWAGIGGEGLQDLAQKVQEALADFVEDENDFRAHITLARLKPTPHAASLRGGIGRRGATEIPKLLASLNSHAKFSFVVSEFALYQSELSGQGAIHTKLSVFSLK